MKLAFDDFEWVEFQVHGQVEVVTHQGRISFIAGNTTVTILGSKLLEAVRSQGLSALNGRIFRCYQTEGYLTRYFELMDPSPGFQVFDPGSFVVYPDRIYYQPGLYLRK